MEPSQTVVDVGDPGSSLQAEFERRAAARESRVRARHPRIGGFLLAVFNEPATTTAFSTGAVGERRVAARLAELSGPGVLFLHNRLLGPGRRDGDVDHIALTAGGVYVIDAKRYKNAKVRVRHSGGLFSPVREQLMVNGRDRWPECRRAGPVTFEAARFLDGTAHSQLSDPRSRLPGWTGNLNS